MNEEIKETHIRSLYKLLGHQGYYSRVGFLNYSTKTYEQVFLKTEEALIEQSRNHNGTDNIFISRAYRDPNGTVLSTWVCTFDLDPIRAKDTASTVQQHEAALNAGRRILQRYSGGYLASSGNGALLLYRLPSPLVNLEEHYKKEKILVEELQELVKDLNVIVDKTYYDEAVIKVIGTFSTKGDKSLRRCSQFINFPTAPYFVPTQLIKRLSEISVTDNVPLSRNEPGWIKEAFEGLPEGRTPRLVKLVGRFKYDNWSKADTFTCLKPHAEGVEYDLNKLQGIIEDIYEKKGETRKRESPKTSDEYFKELLSPKKESDDSLKTGFKVLDEALGPLPRGELTTFSARSGYGKTTFGCTLAEYWRKEGKKVLYFSTEISSAYIMHKLVSLSCEIGLAKTLQKDFTPEEVVKINAYKQQLLLSPLVICDEFQPTIELVKNQVKQHNPDVIIFDHITQSGTHHEVIAQFTRALKDLANNELMPIILLSMLNEPGRSKDGGEAKSIRGDIRGSQEILFLSGIYCMLSNPYEVKGRFQPVDILVAKNRYGISNNIVQLSVDKDISKFVERKVTDNEQSLQ